jgi:EcsC family protein
VTDPAPQLETLAPPGALWSRMKADPQYAAEHLALEAVRCLGPEATRWAERTRADRPEAGPEALAALAVARFTTLTRVSGAVAGATGLPGGILDVGVLAWTQSRMVLHISAAYGLETAVADRATELLVLQRVYKAAEIARLALGAAAGRERATRLFADAAGRPLTGETVKLGVRLARMAGIRPAKRMFAKVPGVPIVLGSWVDSAATRSLAARARQLYARPS